MTTEALTTAPVPMEPLRSLAPLLAAPLSTAEWGTRNAHDPTVVRGDDGLWYMFSTDAEAGSSTVDAGVHVRTSRDLVHWDFAGTALPGVPAPAFEWSGAQGIWAPEVVRWPGSDGSPARWHMYYSASTFGSNTSAIGLASASAPAGPWRDHGIVVATKAGEQTQNAIDAAITFDRDGAPWLSYGSFFSGIHTLPLGSDGMPLTPGDLGTVIARRNRTVDSAVEGAYVLYRAEEDRYVLFASYDSLFDSYNVRVAVAEQITGPYVDARGAQMHDLVAEQSAIGTKVLGSYAFEGDTAWLAPGHNSILTVQGASGSEYFCVHHVRFEADPSQHSAQLRRVFFTAAGWPVVSPQPFAGVEREMLGGPHAVGGSWNTVRFDPLSTAIATATPRRVSALTDDNAAGVVGEASVGNTPIQLELVLTADGGDGDSVVLDAVVFASWDWAAGRPALSFAGMAPDGIVWVGTQQSRRADRAERAAS